MSAPPLAPVDPRRAKHQFRAALGGARHPRQALTTLDEWRRRLPSPAYEECVAWLASDDRQRWLLGHAFPAAVTDMHRVAPWSALPLRREVAWTAAALLPHGDRLGAYVRARAEVHATALAGAWDDARAALDALHASHGSSYWWIGTRLALLQFGRGLDAQWDTSVVGPATSRISRAAAHSRARYNNARSALTPAHPSQEFSEMTGATLGPDAPNASRTVAARPRRLRGAAASGTGRRSAAR